MSASTVLASLTTFLSGFAGRYDDVFEPHRALGALVGGLSAPVELGQDELLELVLNQATDSAGAVLANSQRAEQWAAIVAAVEALMTDGPWLIEHFGPLSKPPGAEVAQWCDGYLQAYWYCEDVWQEFYAVWEELAADSDDEDLNNVAEFHPVLVNMLFLIAHWDSALEDMENLEELPDNINELFAEIAEGVTHFFLLMREMAASIEGEKTPFTKPATPNRNDLCPCGSGKKFKKCCLN